MNRESVDAFWDGSGSLRTRAARRRGRAIPPPRQAKPSGAGATAGGNAPGGGDVRFESAQTRATIPARLDDAEGVLGRLRCAHVEIRLRFLASEEDEACAKALRSIHDLEPPSSVGRKTAGGVATTTVGARETRNLAPETSSSRASSSACCSRRSSTHRDQQTTERARVWRAVRRARRDEISFFAQSDRLRGSENATRNESVA